MSLGSVTLQFKGSCARCSGPIAEGVLACPACQTLVHAAALQQMAEEAKALEAAGEHRAASQRWESGLPLLPADSTQATWILNHVKDLERAAFEAERERQAQETRAVPWARKLGPLAPIAILLVKSKSLLALFNLKFLVTLFAFFGVYWNLYGAKFGIGFAIAVLVHEMGHYVDIRRRGLPADMPVFLPGLGAYVRWRALGVTEVVKAEVSLAGPLAGALLAFACVGAWWITGDHLWAALARAGAFLNLLNLIPIWVLDGSQGLLAVGRTARWMLVAWLLALWAYSREGLLLFVAGGMAYRALAGAEPTEHSGRVTAYFAVVAGGLVFVLLLVPGQGMGL